jgi:hypothetical protein
MRLFVLADRFQLASLAEQCAQLFGETLDIGVFSLLAAAFVFCLFDIVPFACARSDNVEECYLASLRPGHELLKQQCLGKSDFFH